jgi:hypothetical protein
VPVRSPGSAFCEKALFVPFALALLLATSVHINAQSSLSGIKISRGSFNPSINESVEITFDSPADGQLTFQILDRDGYVVRTLASNKPIEKGAHRVMWDGRNADGSIVADEAYSIKIDIRSDDKRYTYFPGDEQLNEVKAELGYYDRQNRILNYKLPKQSRIHAHAGSAVVDPKTKEVIGPVLKTLVNREPRIAGSIVEYWSGLDESGTIYVPALPNFVFSISASELPENSIIAVGNKSLRFEDTLKNRKGVSLFKRVANDHPHHRDLSTFRDISPVMKLRPLNGTWSEKDKAWIVDEDELSLEGHLEGHSADAFSKMPGKMGVFLNDKLLWSTSEPKAVFKVTIPLKTISEGLHYIAVNWGTEFGPLVVNAFQIKIMAQIKSTKKPEKYNERF